MKNSVEGGSGSEKIVQRAESHKDLVEKYRLFGESVGFKTGVIYYPCGANDISPSEAFPGSKVIYVDVDDRAMQVLRDGGHAAQTADALTFNPGSVDVLILLNPQISADVPVSFVREGGFVLCNDYHGTATQLHESGQQAIGILRVVGQQLVFDREQPERYWEEIETDEEFKAAPYSWGAVSYEEAVNTLSRIRGENVPIDGDSVIEQYQNLIDMIRVGGVPGKWTDMGDSLMRTNDTFVVQTELPRRKGGVDDVFVFQK